MNRCGGSISALGEEANRLRGQRISIGPEGSGTRALALQLLKRTGMEAQVGELLALEPREAGKKLLAGEIDMAFMMTSWESPVVQQLLADDRLFASRGKAAALEDACVSYRACGPPCRCMACAFRPP